METALDPAAPLAGNRPAEAFIELLRVEQARYLDAIGRARAGLAADAGQLAHLSAIHSRLTRQFFDAQRLLMVRRAEVDTEVADLLQRADADAAATVQRAREQVARGVCATAAVAWAPPIAPAAELIDLAIDELTPRQQIAALGRSVLRTKADADALAGMLDEALQPDRLDDQRFALSLGALLDEWWLGEVNEGREIVDDARARAEIRRRVAEIEADDLLVTAFGASVATAPTGGAVATSPVARAVQTFGLEGLRELLAALADSLYPPMESTTRPAVPEHQPARADGVLIVFDGAVSTLPPVAPLGASSTGIRWDDGRRRGADRPPRRALRSTVGVASLAAVASVASSFLMWQW